MNGELARDKAVRIVGRIVVETLEESGISLFHSSEACVLQFMAKCADPEFEKAFNEILERVGNYES